MRSKISDSEMLESLLRKEDIALAMLFEAYANDLFDYFKIEFLTVDEQILQSCVCDSLIEFAGHPERYQPEKSALRTYLILDIKRNILNAIDKDRRRKKKIVELSSKHGNNKEDDETPDEDINTAFLKHRVEEYFKSVFNDALDQRLAWMIMIEKKRQTSTYIDLLNIQQLSGAAQKDEVKKNKDRISAQLRRKGWANFIKKLKQDATR